MLLKIAGVLNGAIGIVDGNDRVDGNQGTDNHEDDGDNDRNPALSVAGLLLFDVTRGSGVADGLHFSLRC